MTVPSHGHAPLLERIAAYMHGRNPIRTHDSKGMTHGLQYSLSVMQSVNHSLAEGKKKKKRQSHTRRRRSDGSVSSGCFSSGLW